jgi:hypothetical protein
MTHYVGDLGKSHNIHATVNNRHDEHQYTMLETSCTTRYHNYSILIDPNDIERFISSEKLKRIKVKAVKQDEFKYVEMASSAKQKVGGKVTICRINLGDF